MWFSECEMYRAAWAENIPAERTIEVNVGLFPGAGVDEAENVGALGAHTMKEETEFVVSEVVDV